MLDVVIVNFRTAGLTIECLESMEEELQKLSAVRVWVVENGSGDDSAQKLSAAIQDRGWQSWAKLIVLDKNRGFSGGNNVAIKQALESQPRSDFVLLLNPDTLVRPGAFSALLQFMEQNPRAGIAGSRLENLDGSVQVSAFRFPTWLGEFEMAFRTTLTTRLLDKWVVAPPQIEKVHRTQWVCGASMLIRRQVFEQIGILDGAYFMYFEEVDFCLRAAKQGWECWYVPESRVVHLVGQSSGVTTRTRKRRPRYWFDARRHFFIKNYGYLRTWLANILWAGGYGIYRIGAFIRHAPPLEDPIWLWWDFIRFNFAPGRKRTGPGATS